MEWKMIVNTDENKKQIKWKSILCFLALLCLDQTWLDLTCLHFCCLVSTCLTWHNLPYFELNCIDCTFNCIDWSALTWLFLPLTVLISLHLSWSVSTCLELSSLVLTCLDISLSLLGLLTYLDLCWIQNSKKVSEWVSDWVKKWLLKRLSPLIM